MKRGGPLKRRTRLRQVSLRRLAEKPKRQAVVAEVIARDGPGCYAVRPIVGRRAVAVDHGWPLTCAGPLDPHEIIPRSAWPGGHLVASNVRMVCRRHHEWIGDHPVTAATLGLHGYSHERP